MRNSDCERKVIRNEEAKRQNDFSDSSGQKEVKAKCVVGDSNKGQSKEADEHLG